MPRDWDGGGYCGVPTAPGQSTTCLQAVERPGRASLSIVQVTKVKCIWAVLISCCAMGAWHCCNVM